mmetsp:Transcript_109009/g.319052  ORF Transcript_109009/g.319052 Transcript_109009/m.319052 type:complete len:619 (-) Transcript_109009:453-2309(-)
MDVSPTLWNQPAASGSGAVPGLAKVVPVLLFLFHDNADLRLLRHGLWRTLRLLAPLLRLRGLPLLLHQQEQRLCLLPVLRRLLVRMELELQTPEPLLAVLRLRPPEVSQLPPQLLHAGGRPGFGPAARLLAEAPRRAPGGRPGPAPVTPVARELSPVHLKAARDALAAGATLEAPVVVGSPFHVDVLPADGAVAARAPRCLRMVALLAHDVVGHREVDVRDGLPAVAAREALRVVEVALSVVHARARDALVAPVALGCLVCVAALADVLALVRHEEVGELRAADAAPPALRMVCLALGVHAVACDLLAACRTPWAAPALAVLTNSVSILDEELTLNHSATVAAAHAALRVELLAHRVHELGRDRLAAGRALGQLGVAAGLADAAVLNHEEVLHLLAASFTDEAFHMVLLALRSHDLTRYPMATPCASGQPLALARAADADALVHEELLLDLRVADPAGEALHVVALALRGHALAYKRLAAVRALGRLVRGALLAGEAVPVRGEVVCDLLATDLALEALRVEVLPGRRDAFACEVLLALAASHDDPHGFAYDSLATASTRSLANLGQSLPPSLLLPLLLALPLCTDAAPQGCRRWRRGLCQVSGICQWIPSLQASNASM